MSEPRAMTILFADVAGSVDMYSRLGDAAAHRRIVELQQGLSEIVECHDGRIVEIIGDEIMCSFIRADDAFTAALQIQLHTELEAEPELNVRIGFHSGPTSEHEGHPFGDTVNVAARVVALAKAGQVMLTAQSREQLDLRNRAGTGFFNKVSIKGKREPFTIYQAIPEEEDRTLLIESEPPQGRERRRGVTQIQLDYEGVISTVEEGEEILLGRGEQCQLKIDSQFASRVHAIIACRSGRLVLEDRSANGTYIRMQTGKRASDGEELFLHQDQWSSTSGGQISLGEPFPGKAGGRIGFSCKTG